MLMIREALSASCELDRLSRAADVIAAVSEQAARSFGADAALLLLPSEEGELAVASSYGVDARRTAEVRVAAGSDAAAELVELARRLGFASCAAVPFGAAGEHAGALALLRRD